MKLCRYISFIAFTALSCFEVSCSSTSSTASTPTPLRTIHLTIIAPDTAYIGDTVLFSIHGDTTLPRSAHFIYAFDSQSTIVSTDSNIRHCYNTAGMFNFRSTVIDTAHNGDTLGSASHRITILDSNVIFLNLLHALHTLHVTVHGAWSRFDNGLGFNGGTTVIDPLNFDETFSSINWDSIQFSGIEHAYFYDAYSFCPPDHASTDTSAQVVTGLANLGSRTASSSLHVYHHSTCTKNSDGYGSDDHVQDFDLSLLSLQSIDSSHIVFQSNSSSSLRYTAQQSQMEQHENIHNYHDAHETTSTQYPVAIRLEFTR